MSAQSHAALLAKARRGNPFIIIMSFHHAVSQPICTESNAMPTYAEITGHISKLSLYITCGIQTILSRHIVHHHPLLSLHNVPTLFMARWPDHYLA